MLLSVSQGKDLRMKIPEEESQSDINSKNMTSKTVFILVLLIITSFLTYFFYFNNTEEKELIEQGNVIVEGIKSYKLKEGHLPSSLNDIGIEEKMESPFYYTRWDSVNYILYFTRAGVGESMNYYSDTKEWSHIQRALKSE